MTQAPTRKLSSSWAKLLGRIPGYDPFRLAAGHYFDPEEARRALDFFSQCLSHVKGAFFGRPFTLERWQQSIVANLFGWRREADNLRRYREAFVLVPRKNGKTALSAGIALYLLFCDGEFGAEVYAAAADRDQAALLFDSAKQMVLREPVLKDACDVYQRSISIDSMFSVFRVISADAKTKHGFNAHGVIVDELHAQPDAELVDVLETSQGSRTQPLFLSITTADYQREGSICNEKQDYAERVRDGIVDDAAFLPVIYRADEERDDWTSPRVWRRCNPNLGVSVSMEYLRERCRRAQELPRYENTFKRLFLNIRTGQASRWLPMDAWDRARGGEAMGFTTEGEFTREALESYLKGRACYGGLDLSSTRDITAFVLAFPLEAGAYAALAWFWLPEETAAARARADKVPYPQWAREGWIELTEGNAVDYARVRARVGEIAERFRIREIAVDRWNAEHLAQDLRSDGLEPVMFGQGYASMSAPSKELEKLVLAGRLYHGGNPVLRWMASNVQVEEDAAGNIKPSKRRSGEKIDGIVALVMALGRAVLGGGEKKDSVYKKRGLIRV